MRSARERTKGSLVLGPDGVEKRAQGTSKNAETSHLAEWSSGKVEEGDEESQAPETENDPAQREYTKLAIETTMRCEERREEEAEEDEGKYGKKSLHCQGNGDIERNISGNQNMLKICSNWNNHTAAPFVNVSLKAE
jgi:hypothetical protein